MCQFEYRGNRFIENISCIALQKISEENNLFRDFTIQYLIQATFYKYASSY